MAHIIGHKKILEELRCDFEENRLAHGYLFIGTAGLGKFAVAKWFCKLMQCEGGGCDSCIACKQIEAGGHIDTVEMRDTGESIKIEPIRDVIARLNMTPQSPYKILIMKNIGRMTPEAANAMLKTLEEPPERTIFILTAESLQRVLPTITSRMRMMRFTRMTDEALREELNGRYPEYDPSTIESVVTLSLGKPSRAVSLMENQDRLSEMMQLYSEAETLLQKKSAALSFMTAESLSVDEKRLNLFMEILLLLARKYMLESDNAAVRQRCAAFIENTINTQDLLEKNVNTRLLLENLLLHMV